MHCPVSITDLRITTRLATSLNAAFHSFFSAKGDAGHFRFFVCILIGVQLVPRVNKCAHVPND